MTQWRVVTAACVKGATDFLSTLLSYVTSYYISKHRKTLRCVTVPCAGLVILWPSSAFEICMVDSLLDSEWATVDKELVLSFLDSLL